MIKAYTILSACYCRYEKKGFETADGISLLKMGLKFHSPKKLVHLIDPLGLGQVSI